MSKKKFFSGNSVRQAVLDAAAHFAVPPDEIAYREVEKKAGFLKTRKRAVIAVDAEDPRRRLDGEEATAPPSVVTARAASAAPPAPPAPEPAEAERPRRPSTRRGGASPRALVVEAEPEPAEPLEPPPPVDEEEAPRPSSARRPRHEEEEEEPFEPEEDELEGEDLDDDDDDDEDDEEDEEDEEEDEPGIAAARPPSAPAAQEDEATAAGGRRRRRRRGGRGRGRAGEAENAPAPAGDDDLVALPERPLRPSERYAEARGPLADAARDALDRVLAVAGLDLSYTVHQGPDRLEIDLSGPDEALLVAEGGELLRAIEHLVPRAVRSLSGEPVNIRVDSADFHEIHEEQLRSLAQRVASEVRRSERPRTLEPLSPADRRIVHLTLADEPRVTSMSEGTGYFKRIVVKPA